MRFLAGTIKPNPWGARLNWDSALISRVFSGKQRLGAEALAQLATAERVNLLWLLTGEGEPYTVLPIPDPAVLSFGDAYRYYLFADAERFQQPLIRVGPASKTPTPIQVYAGDSGDLIDVLERFAFRRQPVYLAVAEDQMIQDLRQGRASNRVLLDENGHGILENVQERLDLAEWTSKACEPSMDYFSHPSQKLPEAEREWLMLLRELPEKTRNSVLDIMRELTKQQNS